MTTISINKFDGGIAEDPRTTKTNECQESSNFDILTNQHKIIPLPDTLSEVSTAGGSYSTDELEVSDVVYGSYNGGTNYALVALGNETDTSSKVSFYRKSSIENNWERQAVGATSALIRGTLIAYKNHIYAMSVNGALQKYNGTVSTVGTVTITPSGSTPYLFVHPKDNTLYIAVGTNISTWDGTTLTNTTTILPVGMEAVGISDYGDYLAIAMSPIGGGGNSTVYLWNRDTSINTLSESVDVGKGDVVISEQLDNRLFIIINDYARYGTTTLNKTIIKAWSGGAVETIKTIQTSSLITPSRFKAKRDNRLYFALNNGEDVFCLGKNKDGVYIVSDYQFVTDGTANPTIVSVSTVNDALWVGSFANIGGLYTLNRSRSSSDSGGLVYTNTSTYKTTINSGMPIADRHKLKQLKAVQISYTGASSGTTTLKYSVDGSDFASIIVDTNAIGEKDTEATNENDGKSLLSGREFEFKIESIGGSEIKEIKYEYTVLNTTI